jgi:ABC-type Fe3+/spermidine/putrescine transport system ATPase subunit
MFSLDGVDKSYGSVAALRSLTCEIPTDRFVFVMGPSGSGKSTLLRLLSFVETPDRGSVSLMLDGREFNSVARDRPWPILTCVFQKQFLWPHLTLRQNIALPLRNSDPREANSRLQRVIALLGMSAFVDRFPNEVSGGEAQRAALARALALNPRLILIDEAHGGLDLEQQKLLNEHLLGLRESGVGLVVVTHSLEFARSYADWVVVLEGGSVTDLGPRNTFDKPNSAFLRTILEFGSH